MVSTKHLRMLPVALLVSGLGCLQQLDREGTVKDLRILAIRAEPAELVDDPLPEEVRFEALVLDPRLPDPFAVELSWQFCPVESELFCRDYDEIVNKGRAEVPIDPVNDGNGGTGAPTIPGFPDCPASPATLEGLAQAASVLAQLSQPTALEHSREVVEGDAYELDIGAGVRPVSLDFLASIRQDLTACGVPAAAFELPQQTSDLHLYHFMRSPLESLLGVWPTVVLTAQGAAGETLTAQKRLPVHFRHPSSPLLLLKSLAPNLNLGVDVCPPGIVAPQCLAVEPHAPNKNPEFAAIRLRDGRDAHGGPFDTFWTPEEGPDPRELPPRRVRVMESLRIDPVFTPESEETYQRFRVDAKTLEVSVFDDREVLSVSWFSTGGIFRDETTWVEGTVSLDTALDAPEEPGLIEVFMVARDQRGGIAWKGFRVEVVD